MKGYKVWTGTNRTNFYELFLDKGDALDHFYFMLHDKDYLTKSIKTQNVGIKHIEVETCLICEDITEVDDLYCAKCDRINDCHEHASEEERYKYAD